MAGPWLMCVSFLSCSMVVLRTGAFHGVHKVINVRIPE